jgi:hypothetical protein
MNFTSMFGVVLPAVTIVAVFTFVAIAVWSDNRRKERESYYREETYKKLLDSTGGAGEAVLAVMKQEEIQKERRRIEGLKLGGLVTTAVGIGVMVFLWAIAPGEAVYLAGIIPLLIGVVLAVYAYGLAPKS